MFGMGGFPFGGMPGGMPGGFPGMDGASAGPVNNSRYYEILGVSKDASDQEIKKAHRKLALKLHPDKGGDPDKFKEINEAYDVLKNPETRQLYDQHGEEFIKEGGANAGGGGGGMSDLFDMLNGGRGGRGGPRGPRKSDDITQKLHVSLKDFYLGTTKKLLMKRPLKCETCDGTGSKSKVKSTCQRCKGAGAETVVRQIGPGMMTQMQRPCSQCRGKGTTRKPGDECRACSGEGIVEDQKKFEVVLEKGAPDGHKITLREEAGVSEPGMLPGDVNFLFVQNKGEDDDWRRQGTDLLMMDFPISLKQALCASELHLRHLDGRVVNMKREPGVPLKPGEWVRVPEEGMPVFGRPYSKGNLYVRITVVMPSSLLPAALAKVGELLPDDGECTPMDTDDADEVKLADVGPGERLQEELQMRMRAYRQQQSAYDSDEEEGHGQQRVQCAQQ